MIQPHFDRVVIKEEPPDTTSPGGIFLPDNARELKAIGEIIAVGEGYIMEDGTVRPLSVIPGDRVVFQPSQTSDLEIDGEKYQLIRERNIFGVLEA